MPAYSVQPTTTGMIVAIRDRNSLDWGAIGTCGHVSGLYTSSAAAEAWRCPVCDELEASHRNARYLLDRMGGRL